MPRLRDTSRLRRRGPGRKPVAVVTLPLAPGGSEGEPEVREAFSLAAKARTFGREAQDVTDRWFFETVVRVRRSGEGAPFTGLKPAGLDAVPAIPVAEHALDAGSADELTEALCGIIRSRWKSVTAGPWRSRSMPRRGWLPPAHSWRPASACRRGRTTCTNKRSLSRTHQPGTPDENDSAGPPAESGAEDGAYRPFHEGPREVGPASSPASCRRIDTRAQVVELAGLHDQVSGLP